MLFFVNRRCNTKGQERLDQLRGDQHNPGRRAGEHKSDGKSGRLQAETRPMSRGAAERWEANPLKTYRDNHGGKNPPHNKTRNG